MGSVALKARRRFVGKCLCVVPTVQMRTPEGVVVNQYPLWKSAAFSVFCPVQTHKGFKDSVTLSLKILNYPHGFGRGGIIQCHHFRFNSTVV